MSEQFERLPAVQFRTGLSKASIYVLGKKGLFPKPSKLRPGGRAVGWPKSVIDKYIADRIADTA